MLKELLGGENYRIGLTFPDSFSKLRFRAGVARELLPPPNWTPHSWEAPPPPILQPLDPEPSHLCHDPGQRTKQVPHTL